MAHLHPATTIAPQSGFRPAERSAFSLLEVLVSCAVFIMILTVVTGVMNGASSLWLRHRNQSAAFEAANAAFDQITRSVAQAVLNTYWEVKDGHYGRSSELHFLTGRSSSLLSTASANYPGDAIFFQAALGRSSETGLKRLPYLLNNIGYFVRFDEGPPLPGFLQSMDIVPRPRFRLYEWLEPTEGFAVYKASGGGQQWFQHDLQGGQMTNTAVLAENVLGLIFLAEYPNAANDIVPAYAYDSRDSAKTASANQLPPRIRVLMAVVDEASARRIQSGSTAPDLGPDPNWFTVPTDFNTDLALWEDKLKAVTPRIDYRFFIATVTIQNAKWSL